MATIDNLRIEINAQAVKANEAIDRLVTKLDRLTTSLNKLDGSKLTGLANGVQRLGTAMQTMNTIKTSDFTRLANNLTKLGTVNVSALNSAASSMSHLTRAFNSLGKVSANAQAVGDMAKNIAKLGNKSVQTAIANIPQLAESLNSLMTTLSKSPKVSQNVIQMTNALANLASQGRKVGSASSSLVKGLNNSRNAADKAKKSFGGLASAIGKFYASYFLVVRGVKGLFGSIESTADYIEALNYQTVAFNKIASEWSRDYEKYGYENAESYAESFSDRVNSVLGKMSGLTVDIEGGLLTESGTKNLGLNIQEITQYASQLASVTNSIGQTGEVSTAATKSMTMLAGDISSLFNMDYSSVAQNLQSGLIGQSRALYKYGIDITNATLQTYAYELGLSKTVLEMTQAEKQQLRLIAILDQSRVSWGDLANTINSPSNMLRQFTNNIKETGMVLGQLFIPVLSKVMPVINGVTIAIKRLLVDIAGLMGVKIDFSQFGQNEYTDVSESLDDVSDSFENATSAAKEYENQLLGFDEVTKLSELTDSTSGTNASGGTIDLTNEILKATEEYEKEWNKAFANMENKAQKWADKIEKILEPVKKIIEDFAIGDFFTAGEDVSNLVISINDFISNAIDNVNWKQVGKNVGKFLAGIKWIEVFKSFSRIVIKALQGAVEFWFSSLKEAPIETAIITAIAGWKFNGVASKFISLAKAHPFITAATIIAGIIINWDEVSEFLKTLVDEIAEVLHLDELFGFASKEIREFADKVNEEIKKVEFNKLELPLEIESIEKKAEAVQLIADAYYNLSQNANLSEDDLKTLDRYKEKLEEFGINVDSYIEPETNAWKGTKEALDDLISSQTQHLKILAYQDSIVEAEKDLLLLQKNISETEKEISANSTYEKIISQIEEMQKAGMDLSEIYNMIEGGKNALGYNKYFGSFSRTDVESAITLYKTLQKTTNAYKEQEKYVSTLYTEVDILSGNVKETNKEINSGIQQLGNISNIIGQIEDKSQQATNNIGNNFKNMASSGVYYATKLVSELNMKFNGIKTPDIKVKTSSATTAVSNAVTAMNLGLGLIKTPNITANTKLATTAVSSSVVGMNASLSNIKTPSINVDTSQAVNKVDLLKQTIETALKKIKINLPFTLSNQVNTSALAGLSIGVGSIPAYATGGFPEDGLFFANQNELVGKFSNGKTAVANDLQITAGIEEASYRGMMRALSENSGKNVNVTFEVQGDPNNIFKVVQKQANNYTMQTGKTAFLT